MNLLQSLPRFFLIVLFGLLSATAVRAEETPPVGKAAEKSSKAEVLPGVALSQGITEVTGVAISPLLGVSSVGAWRYFRTDAGQRAGLPWFCHPAAWGCGFGVLLLCFLKDTLGTAVPGIFKKPLDMVELFENKASALVASAGFVPVLAREMAQQFQYGKPAEAATALLLPLASITGSSVVAVSTVAVFVIASVVAFLAVWLSGHAINVLIILSPFSMVDALLKVGRFGVLVMISLAYLIAPWLAAGICLGIIALALWLAPATLRLAVFGTRYAGDVLLPWFGRRRATDHKPHAFTLGRFPGLPVRTSGRLITTREGRMEFRYRPWWIGAERGLPLPEGQPLLAKGLLSPAIFVRKSGDEGEAKVLLLLPRYRGREETIHSHFGFSEIRDHALSRGVAMMRAWWKEQFRQKRKAVTTEEAV